MADIFLSYAREDRPWASRLAAGLMERGWSLFWDSHIPVGKTFDQVIENQLDAAGCIVVLWSRHSVSSNWVKAEASEGARRGILHPVLIENVKLPLEFRRLQTANLVDWQGGTSHAEFDQLIGGIAAILSSPTRLLQEARAALGSGDHVRFREAGDAGLGDEVAELRRTGEAVQDEARPGELRGQRAQGAEQRAGAEAAREREQHDGAAEGNEKAADLFEHAPPTPALPKKRPKSRPTGRLGGSRLVACVGGIAIVLTTLGIYWYQSAQKETQQILTVLPSAVPQPPESRPSPPSAEAPKVVARAEDESPQAITVHLTAQTTVAQGDHDKAGGQLKDATAGSGHASEPEKAKSVRHVKLKEADVKGEPVRDRVVGPSGARTDAEQAQLRMSAAKRSAEQVAAGFYAHKRFYSAQSKERDGMAALGQSDYGKAIRLLVEAQSEYQAAVPEATREAEKRGQLAPLTASLEQAHAAAAAQRQQALAAAADHLAKDVFDQAQARQVEADGLENRQELAAAAQAYRDAAERYGEATLRARAARATK